MNKVVPTANSKTVRRLDRIAGMLELDIGSGFKSRAYRRGSPTIRDLSISFGEIVKDSVNPETVPGIGKVIVSNIKKYLNSGHVIAYERLKEIHSPLTLALLDISGLGGVTTKRLLKDTGATTVPELIVALSSVAITWLLKTGERSATMNATQLRGSVLLDPEPVSVWI